MPSMYVITMYMASDTTYLKMPLAGGVLFCASACEVGVMYE